MSFLEGYQTTPSFQTFHSENQTSKLSLDEVTKRKQLEQPKIDSYLALNDEVFNAYHDKVYTGHIMVKVNELLNINPELYTIWNYKRDLIVNLKLMNHDFISKELMFVLLKLKSFPKSYWIWNHRIWLLSNDPEPDWKMELMLIDKFFQADSRNFHAWQYRRVVIKMMRGDILDEWKFTKNMINKDISNYSAWHNRSTLIKKMYELSFLPQDSEDEYIRIFQNKDNKLAFIELEWELVKTAIYTDAEDSSVWFYIKWILSDYFIQGQDSAKTELLLNKIFGEIEELNQLELEDNDFENKWCINTKLYILEQLEKVDGKDRNESKIKLKSKLKKLDPMRQNRYV